MTINLEKELIRQNRKLATPEELLQVREYEQKSEFVSNDALSRVGLNGVIKNGMSIKNRIDGMRGQTSAFKQERVFHISQIEAVCKKYYLRFLPSEMFHGSVDPNLATKIVNFEAAYLTKCHTGNTYIAAPAASFKLEERPKDPLFFYQINKEYFYLIHKWGNDLSVFRQVLTWLSLWWVNFSIVAVALVALWSTVHLHEGNQSVAEGIHVVSGTLLSIMTVIWCIWSAVQYDMARRWNDEFMPTLIRSNKQWNSRFRD